MIGCTVEDPKLQELREKGLLEADKTSEVEVFFKLAAPKGSNCSSGVFLLGAGKEGDDDRSLQT